MPQVDKEKNLLCSIAFISYLKGSSLPIIHAAPPAISAIN